MTVLVVMGGESAERPISLLSGAAVVRALAEGQRRVEAVVAEPGGRWRRVDVGAVLDGLPDRIDVEHGVAPSLVLNEIEPRVVFPTLHGPRGEDGTFQGLCRVLAVPCVGAGVLASAVCMDKIAAKQLAAAHGLPQTDWVAIGAGDDGADRVRRAQLTPTLFVKPANMGSSIGVGRVSSVDELEAAIEHARRYDDDILVESAIEGNEVSCAVLGVVGSRSFRVSPLKLSTTGEAWLDYDAKYQRGRPVSTIPAAVSPEISTEATGLAERVAAIYRIEGMARIDFFLESGSDRLLLNEVNTIPGLTERSSVPRMWAAAGVSVLEMIDELCVLAIERHRRTADRDGHRERSRPG